MFERFTDQARRTLVLAQDEARRLHHNAIAPEHVLLALLQVDDTALELLQPLGVGYEATRARIEKTTPAEPEQPGGQLPFTPEAKKGLEMALREALQLGDPFIGTEHLLLGLLRKGEGPAAGILREGGADLEALRRQVKAIDADSRRGEVDPPEPEVVSVPAEELARLVAEVARLRDLLRRHGIDPGEERPGFGEE